MRAEGLLSSLVPAELGGTADTLADVAQAVTALGRHCGSTAMVFAMHEIRWRAWPGTAPARSCATTCAS